MSDSPQVWRERARECRAIAGGVRNETDRAVLEQIADDLEEEARKIEAEAGPNQD